MRPIMAILMACGLTIGALAVVWRPTEGNPWRDSPGVITFRHKNLELAREKGWILSWEQTGVKTGRVIVGPNFANLKTGSERYVYTWIHQELFPAEVLDREAVLEIVSPNGERIGVFP